MSTIWVKTREGQRLRDHRTNTLWPEGDAPQEIPANDLVFAQLINHGDLIVCNEDGSPLVGDELPPVPEPQPAAKAAKGAPAAPAPADPAPAAPAQE